MSKYDYSIIILSFYHKVCLITFSLRLHVNVAMQVTSANCSDGDVRLVDGSVDYEGRVEVCINRVWGTVCSTTSRYTYYTYWDLSEAKVVCRQLGHQELGATVYTSSSTFGAGNDPVFLSDFQCVGSEANLLQCRNSNFVKLGNNHHCTHSRDVGLRCERKKFVISIHILYYEKYENYSHMF